MSSTPNSEDRGEAHRGRLQVFLGYAAGVGKTYRMLEEAQQLQKQGKDIVIGYFEPHARKDTIAKTIGPVVVGDDDGTPVCAGNTISGAVSITGGHGGVEFDGNTVKGRLTIKGNTGTLSPPDSGAVDVVGNTVKGRVKVQP